MYTGDEKKKSVKSAIDKGLLIGEEMRQRKASKNK